MTVVEVHVCRERWVNACHRSLVNESILRVSAIQFDRFVYHVHITIKRSFSVLLSAYFILLVSYKKNLTKIYGYLVYMVIKFRRGD